LQFDRIVPISSFFAFELIVHPLLILNHMHRARLTRTRYTSSYAYPTTKLNKNSLCGISDHAQRSTRAPRAIKRPDSGRRVSTVDVCAFASAIRGAAINQPLFHKTGVMRYDPLKKNVVRPFRALFNFVFGVLRGVVHSALTLGTSPLCVMFPIGKLLTNRKTNLLKSQRKGLPNPPKLRKSESTQSVPALASHPLRCFKRTGSEYPLKPAACHRRGRSLVVEGSSKEISDVLKAYNTSESRDRLITKLKDMKKSGTAECIKNLSHRALEQQPSLTRQEFIMCKQEMVHLSKQLSGTATDHRTPSRHYRRSISVMERPAAHPKNLDRTFTFDRPALRPESQPLQRMSMESLTERAKEVTLKKKEVLPALTRSESLRMQLKQHEHMVNTLKSKYAALGHSRDRGGRNA